MNNEKLFKRIIENISAIKNPNITDLVNEFSKTLEGKISIEITGEGLSLEINKKDPPNTMLRNLGQACFNVLATLGLFGVIEADVFFMKRKEETKSINELKNKNIVNQEGRC